MTRLNCANTDRSPCPLGCSECGLPTWQRPGMTFVPPGDLGRDPTYAGYVHKGGPGGSFAYTVRGPSGFVHIPPKGWRTRGMAQAALQRSLRRYEAKP